MDFGDIIEKLDNMPDAIHGKLVRGVFRNALEPMFKVARAYAPKRSGRLAVNIKLRAGKRSRNKISVIISASDEAGPSGETYYGWFQERGWKHWRSKREVAGKHFLARAFDETQNVVVQNIEDMLSQAVAEYWK